MKGRKRVWRSMEVVVGRGPKIAFVINGQSSIFFLFGGEISSFSSVYGAVTTHFARFMVRVGSEWSSLTP